MFTLCFPLSAKQCSWIALLYIHRKIYFPFPVVVFCQSKILFGSDLLFSIFYRFGIVCDECNNLQQFFYLKWADTWKKNCYITENYTFPSFSVIASLHTHTHTHISIRIFNQKMFTFQIFFFSVSHHSMGSIKLLEFFARIRSVNNRQKMFHFNNLRLAK